MEDREGGDIRQRAIHMWGEEMHRAGGTQDVGDELFLRGARSQEECPCQAELVLTPLCYVFLFTVN